MRKAVEEAVNGVRNQQILEMNQRIYRIFASPIVMEDIIKDEEAERQSPTGEAVPSEQVEGVIVVILDETEKEKRETLRREFTSNVSHELKTPLTSISGVAEIIMNGIVKKEDIPGFAKNIYEEAGRLIGLVNDIIFLSKLDEEAKDFETSEVHLLDIAKEVKERLVIPCRERNVTIEVTGEDTVIDGVPSMIEEVIYNLCDNGIKYNKEGGTVSVTIKQDDENHQAVISVKDSGIGIPSEDKDRVFERFYRVDKSHSREIGGTGLGLSIVKHVVMYHNGIIHVDSTMGEGTTITVILPLKVI